MQVGVGISEKSLDWEAAREAAKQAVAMSGPPELAIVLTTDQYDQETVLRSAKSALGACRIVGACTAGLFTATALFEQGVGVLTFAGAELRAATALVPYLPDDSGKAGIALGEKLLAGGWEDGTFICFPDGISDNISRVINGLYDATGPEFSFIGGGAVDNLRFSRSFQMNEEGGTSNAVAAALLCGCTTTTLIGHEWEPSGPPLVINRARGKTVYELDGRPAFEVYSERFGGINADDFYRFAMRFPFGISNGCDSYLVRDPIKVVNNAAIEFASEIPKRAVAYIMRPREGHPFSLAEDLGSRAFASMKRPQGALISYCVSRALLRGADYANEIASLLRPFGRDFPALGFLALGEFGCYGNGPQLHNKSIAMMVGGE